MDGVEAQQRVLRSAAFVAGARQAGAVLSKGEVWGELGQGERRAGGGAAFAGGGRASSWWAKPRTQPLGLVVAAASLAGVALSGELSGASGRVFPAAGTTL